MNSYCRLRQIPALFAICALAVLWACGKSEPQEHGHDDGHDHGSEQSHGHGKEEKEEHAEEVRLSPEAVKRHGIQIGTAEKRRLIPTLRAPAEVAFNSEMLAHVGSPVRGRVAEVRAKLGEEVKKGDVLLVVESPELGEAQSDYLQKKSLTVTSKPALEIAKNTHERALKLYEKSQGIALFEVQKREAEYRAAQAALQNAQTAEMAAKNRLRLLGMNAAAIEKLEETNLIQPHFSISSPLDGQVTEREVTLGELVGPEREHLMVVADLSKLWVLARFPEARLKEVSLGAKARVLLGGGGGEHWCEGSISYISPAVDPATRTVRMRIVATDRHAELRPGAFAQAEIELSGSEGEEQQVVLSIPEAAVQTVEGQTAVFMPVSGEPNTFVKRPVSVGRVVGGMLPVLSGLSERDSLVVAGSFILKAEFGKSSAEHEH